MSRDVVLRIEPTLVVCSLHKLRQCRDREMHWSEQRPRFYHHVGLVSVTRYPVDGIRCKALDARRDHPQEHARVLVSPSLPVTGYMGIGEREK